jgi:hypothetical protein
MQHLCSTSEDSQKESVECNVMWLPPCLGEFLNWFRDRLFTKWPGMIIHSDVSMGRLSDLYRQKQ